MHEGEAKKKPPGLLRRFFENLLFQFKRISLYELRRGAEVEPKVKAKKGGAAEHGW